MNLIAVSLSGPFPLVQLTIKATLLLAMFFAIWMLARKKSASFRHSILVVALASLPCLAVAQLLLPSQSLPLLERQAVANFERAIDYSSGNDPANTKLLSVKEPLVEPRSESPDGTASHQSSQPSGVFFWSAKNVLLSVWACGSIVLILRFAIAWLIVWRHVRKSPDIEVDGLAPDLKNLIADCQASGWRIRVHREAEQMPLCFGIFRSTILLPRELDDWSFEDQKSVILHESAHAYRRDCLINVLAHFENAVLWFHPLSWMLLRYLKNESEMACDDWAINHGIDSVNYASALFDVTMSTKRKPTVAVVSVSMADCSPLERRMQSILSPSVPRNPLSFIGHILIASASVAAIVCLAGFHLGPSVEAAVNDEETMKIEHRIELLNKKIIRGTLQGSMDLETTYGSAKLNFANIRSIKRIEGGRHEILAEDGTVMKGIITQSSLRLAGDKEQVDVPKIRKVTTIGNAQLIPEKLTSGFLKDNISYHIRAPKGYDPAKAYPAIVFFHDANSNTDSMLEEFASTVTDESNRFLLIGINGENKSKKVENAFSYTYIDFAGRSKYGGFPGTDRQSPALVTEAITELKDRIPISTTYILGKGDGAFLAFSVMMNYPEMIDGVVTINGGLLVQCVPDAYEDEDLIAAQRATPVVMMYSKPDGDAKDSFTGAALRALRKANYPVGKYYQIKDERALPQIYRRTFRGFDAKQK